MLAKKISNQTNTNVKGTLEEKNSQILLKKR